MTPLFEALRKDSRFEAVCNTTLREIAQAAIIHVCKIRQIRIADTAPDYSWYKRGAGQFIYVVDDDSDILRPLTNPNLTIKREHVIFRNTKTLPKPLKYLAETR